ncbi:MAG: 4Fe-4S dicluster domain-containing protein [Methanosarcinaceae archaeon]|nr:4Fe-4S dicluster domain-containing protein [Methanosarcinaceae archaeon]MDD4497496.1 4Fe-4S dicluster domain-containing protein [Methanosarcinaceae archaeon]
MTLIQIDEYDTPAGKSLAETIKASIRTPDSLGLDRCIQCGACTASCPAARFTAYNPRLLVKRVLENDRGVLEDETLWNCFYCYTCQLRCPRNNSPAKLVQVLRQLALNEGIGLENMEHFLGLGEFFAAHGISQVPEHYLGKMAEALGSSWVEFKRDLPAIRAELGLGSLDIRDERKEIRSILEGTGHFERAESLRARLKESGASEGIEENKFLNAIPGKNKSEDINLEKNGRYSGPEALIV